MGGFPDHAGRLSPRTADDAAGEIDPVQPKHRRTETSETKFEFFSEPFLNEKPEEIKTEEIFGNRFVPRWIFLILLLFSLRGYFF
jgi:hypothetical protein